ncbi:Peroxidase [Rhynchospora pubera]|uniref:Peroxidase n=1 Tax=Rhynchospora pubera TaxID=906938 RepID=A0AAV8BN75_9POAL|nr:Peroxidase [Rhynchospora pubera]KAJ4744744.1 Peroxidase [Rhynchospora pubera]KAJ4806104.1 Peroxidase [Rhynchospora pubera]
MALSSKIAWVAIAMLFALFCVNHGQASYLTPNYYDYTCPKALPTIRTVVRNAIAKELRMAASLIRLHFHDCFVQGCDGSVLLKDTPWFTGEQTARSNNNSIRGMEIIDAAKQAVEAICPGVVSCADILTLAARDSSEYVNGPTWTVKLGRRDSTTASRDLAEADLPLASENLDDLIRKFYKMGLNAKEMVVLSGAHTIGQARCVTFRGRIYNETNIDPGFAIHRRRTCPFSNNAGNANLAPLDPVTPNTIDNRYFKILMEKKGLLHSDQVLFNGGKTDDIVAGYRRDSSSFHADFATAMVKMGEINPLTFPSGQIRKICSAIN